MKHRRLLILSLLIVIPLLVGDCDLSIAQTHHPNRRQSPPPVRTSQEKREVAEALFRYLMPQALDDWKGIKVVFLSIDDKDPDKQFLQRFADSPLPVKAASACGTGRPRLQVIDKATKQEGVLLWIDRPWWITKTKVEVKAGYHHDGLGGMWTTYLMVRQGNQWSIQRTGRVKRS